MKEKIDCLFIGHNETDFTKYEQTIKGMGIDSGSYKDLNLNFIRYDNIPYSASDIFNLFYCNGCSPGKPNKALTSGKTFSNAIAYLGTYLHQRGFTFDYVNSFQDDKSKLAEMLEKENILTIAIITTLYVSPLPIMEIVNFIRKHNHTAKIIVGGPFISTQVKIQDPLSLEYLFRDAIGGDFYVNSSQGEATLVKIIRALKQNLPLDNINNIYYKKGSAYISTPVVPEDNKLSENLVKWDIFSDKIGPVVNVRTSISCPFSCAFCGFPERAGKFRVVEPETIMEELRLLHRIEFVKLVHFIDDTFNIPQKRFKEILRLLIKNKFKFKWISNFRSQYADRETVQLMKESGCESVFLGIESGSNQILKNMNKAAAVEQYLKGIDLLKKYEIVTMGSFIVGFPGETHKTVQDTIRFIKESDLDFFRAQLWYCDPITPIWGEKDRYQINGESFEWSHKTMDSKMAARLVDEIFLTFETPVWVPQYHFEFGNIWNLVYLGMSLEQVKNYLTTFNTGVKQKLMDPSKQEVNIEVIKKLRKSLCPDSDCADSVEVIPKGIETENLGFDF